MVKWLEMQFLGLKDLGIHAVLMQMDLEEFLLVNRSNQSSVKLCDEIAMLAARLCTTYIDPGSIEALLACRLIPLDKGDGSVRPIGVGEVIRRIIAKCVVQIAKPEIIQATGSMQVCAGQKSGSEAAIHAMSEMFHGEDTDAVLLIDASNAFSSLNRMTALHNILVTCPIIAPYAINTYRNPARLFVVGGHELLSAEGTTQGDPVSMAFYGIKPGTLDVKAEWGKWSSIVLACRWCKLRWQS